MNIQTKLDKLELLRQKVELQKKIREGLPHLYGYPFYTWSKQFFESENRYNFLCAGNQISKSSTLIRRMIHHATEPKIWPQLWDRRPAQFWYLYPSKDVVNAEWLTKWLPEFMPRGEFKDHPQYGWRVETKNKNVWAIHFNTGVVLFFKTYSQDVNMLQSGTVHEIGCDEELPFHIFPELQFRLAAVNGIFNMAFTATIGQDEWRRCIEERGDKELFKGAFKQQVSMFDCLQYHDGSPAPWTTEKINRIINTCATRKEIDRRVYGKFVVEDGLRFEAFNRELNVVKPYEIPKTWHKYAGVDIGSGGEKGHPSAITMVAVRPDFQKAAVFQSWRGDGIVTAASDVLEKFREMRGRDRFVSVWYDYASKDFFTIASRAGECVSPADKGNERGEQVMNSLFRNQILDIFDIESNQPLIQELLTVRIDTEKRHRKDDAVDSCRYCVTGIPWDWSVIKGTLPALKKEVKPQTPEEYADEVRRSQMHSDGSEADKLLSCEDEIEAWNEFYDI
jgi:hypothetical protein